MSVAETGQWRRAKRCADATCVEIARFDEQVMLRDAADPTGPTLTFSHAAWETFADGVRGGEFDFG